MTEAIQAQIARYSWYHCIEVAPGIVTPGHESFLSLQRPIMAELCRQDLAGKRVLDVGCRDGLFSFEAEKMGAAFVLGIDNDLSRGATEFLIPHFKSKVRMKAANLYDSVVGHGHFDFVLCAGVLYHLRFPFLGLLKLAQSMRVGATLLLETAMWPTRASEALLYCPAPEDSPYEPTSVTFFNEAGLVAAMRSLGFVEITCRNILADTGRSYPVWASLVEDEEYWAPTDRIRTSRAIYTAVRGEDNADLSRYWYGTHSFNSSHSEGNAFLDRFSKARH